MTITTRPEILDQLAALAEPTRARLLLVLEQQPLTVSELCDVLELPQSTVSRHLKLLGDQGWLTKRREGTRHYYSLAILPETERQVWELVGADMADDRVALSDRRRLTSVLHARRGPSQAYFAETGEAWTQIRRDLFGSRFDLLGLLGLLEPTWTVGDLGCGTGTVSASLAPFVRKVIGVDSSQQMLDAASIATAELGNVDLRRGDLEDLPIDDASLDAATLFLVLHHVADPGAVIAEAARVLKPGAPLLIVDMEPHDDATLGDAMGHVWFGFDHLEIEQHLSRAGFATTVIRSLGVDPDARGPQLFTAAGRKPAA